MEQKKLFKILAAIFAMRSVYWCDRAFKENDDWALGLATAYNDAFDMFAYVAEGRWDCLAQFGWSDEAEDLINKIGTDIDFWDLEDLIKGVK